MTNIILLDDVKIQQTFSIFFVLLTSTNTMLCSLLSTIRLRSHAIGNPSSSRQKNNGGMAQSTAEQRNGGLAERWHGVTW
jgi:hypothetical protein